MLRSLVLTFLFFVPLIGYSTHIRGGQIRVEKTGGLTCKIELTMYTNPGSSIRFGTGVLEYGDGFSHVTPTIESTQISESTGYVVYVVEHTYTQPGVYVVSYTEPNLTGGIVNIFNSIETRFYIETSVALEIRGSYSSPSFPTLPTFTAQRGSIYSFSSAVVDDGSGEFFYKYSLVSTPKNVEKYTLPAGLEINSKNGMVTWNTEGAMVGDYWIVLKVDKYSSTNGYLGFVLRAFSLSLMDDFDDNADLLSSVTDEHNKIFVPVGEEKKISVFIDYRYKTSEEELKFDAFFSEKLANNITITGHDSLRSDRTVGYVSSITFTTTEDIVSDFPYAVTLRAKKIFVSDPDRWDMGANFPIDITFLYMTKDVELPGVVTGVEEFVPVSVYPNPFKSELFVEGPASAQATFINTLGQPVLTSPLRVGSPLSTAGLPSGLYFLKVTTENGAVNTLKVVRD